MILSRAIGEDEAVHVLVRILILQGPPSFMTLVPIAMEIIRPGERRGSSKENQGGSSVGHVVRNAQQWNGASDRR